MKSRPGNQRRERASPYTPRVTITNDRVAMPDYMKDCKFTRIIEQC